MYIYVFTPSAVVTHINFYISHLIIRIYEGWNFNSGNYLFTTDTK